MLMYYDSYIYDDFVNELNYVFLMRILLFLNVISNNFECINL